MMGLPRMRFLQMTNQLLGVYRTDITASQKDVDRVNRIDSEGYVLEEKEAMAPGENCFPFREVGGRYFPM